MIPPALLAIALVVGLLVLIPARRLQAAEVAPRAIGLYALTLWCLGMLLTVAPVATRLLAPIVLIAFVAPFVGAPQQLRRVLDRRRPPLQGRPPMKNVTPPETAGDDVG